MIYYRLSPNDDPEERLEDAALWKALHDEFGAGISLVGWDEEVPQDGFLFGRGRKGEWARNTPKLAVSDYLPYWEDPAFLNNCGRHFKVCDYEEAAAEVDALHRAGVDAFVKSTKTKHFTSRVPIGRTLAQCIGEMAYSFIDLPKCLMVQEWVQMKFERRFVVINRKVVTHSPIAIHLTPLDHGVEDKHYLTPKDKTQSICCPQLSVEMANAAAEIAMAMATDHAVIDLCEVHGRVVVVEFNPARVGMFGLYACDVRKIAKAVRCLLDGEASE